jgi:predicted nucleotidyltransferase
VSSARPDLPNDAASAREYVSWLVKLGIASKVLLAGSRGKGTPREDSDWDFVLVTEVSPLRITQPRDMGRLHADLAVTKPDGVHRFPHAVEVWPNDERNLLGAM